MPLEGMIKRLAFFAGLFAVALFACGCGRPATPSETQPLGAATISRVAAEESAKQIPELPDTAVKAADRLIAAELPSPGELALAQGDTQIKLTWTGDLPGDYNLDGAVGGQDIFPLALNFGRETDEEQGLECIDGNGDGTLNGADLFTISVNFLTRIDGWDVWVDEAEDGEFTSEKITAEPLPYQGCGAASQFMVDIVFDSPTYYAVRAWDSAAAESGPRGNVVHPVLACDAPSDLEVTVVDGAAQLSWTAPENPGASGYHVDRRIGEQTLGEWVRLTGEPVTATGYTDGGPRYGGMAEYRVSALSWYGEESEPQSAPPLMTPGGWEITEIWSSTEETWPSGQTAWDSVALDHSGLPGIVFWQYFYTGEEYIRTCYLRYAEFDGAAWSVEDIESALPYGYNSGLAFDADGNPAVVYTPGADTYGGDWDIWLARRIGGVWQKQKILEQEYALFPRLISADTSFADEQLYLTFCAADEALDTTNMSLRLAIENSGSWDVVTLDDTHSCRNGGLNLDPDGNIFAGFINKNGLAKAVWNGSSVDFEEDLGYAEIYFNPNDIGASLDADGDPIFVFPRPTAHGFGVARLKDDVFEAEYPWTSEFDMLTVLSSVIVDGDETPFLTFNSNGTSLKVAWEEDGVWMLNEIDVGFGVLWASLALNSAGEPMLSCCSGQSVYFVEPEDE